METIPEAVNFGVWPLNGALVQATYTPVRTWMF